MPISDAIEEIYVATGGKLRITVNISNNLLQASRKTRGYTVYISQTYVCVLCNTHCGEIDYDGRIYFMRRI